VNPTTTLNVVQLAKQQLAARDTMRQAERDLAALKARDPPATEDELAAEQKILEDAQLKYNTLMSIETVTDANGGQ
jgi:hypothetical protein